MSVSFNSPIGSSLPTLTSVHPIPPTGELDHIPEVAFYMVGNIGDVLAAADIGWLSRSRCTLALSICSISAKHLYAIVVSSSIKLCCQCESVCVCLNVRKSAMFKC